MVHRSKSNGADPRLRTIAYSLVRIPWTPYEFGNQRFVELERPLSIRNHRTLTISRKGRARRDVVGNGLRAEGRRYLGLDVLAKSQTIGQPAEEVIPPEPQALTALP